MEPISALAEHKGRLLVVDDEAELRAMLTRYLQGQGYEVRAAADASALERLLARERFDLIILDLMLPGEDGLSICRRLRAQGETLPILMLTARGDAVDKVLGLEMGADDYLPKPFNPRELLARLGAMLRRQQMLGVAPVAAALRRVTFGPYVLEPTQRQLLRAGEPVALTSGEYALLQTLAQHAGRPLGRERLLELAFGRDHAVTERSIDVQIMRLRRLIEDQPATPRYIQTVRGLGYVLVVDETPGGDAR